MKGSIARLALLLLVVAIALSSGLAADNKVKALFIFGDSTLDAGENNFIMGSKIVSSVLPYGETYFHKPTGRWTDGRIVADFLAQSLGLPLQPPYLKPGADFSHGVNFASAGAGLLDVTNAHKGVFFMSQQLEQFRNLTKHYKQQMGTEAANAFLRDSVVLLGFGANDITLFLRGKEGNISPQELYTNMFEAYRNAMTELYNEGIKNFITLALPPLGCIPNSKAQMANSRLAYGCIDVLNEFVQIYNGGLAQMTRTLPRELPGARMVLLSAYDVILRAMRFPQLYGLTNARDACCGGGPFNAAEFCMNADRHDQAADYKPKYKQFLCEDPSTYLYFDSNHLTEAGYWLCFKNFWHGGATTATPSNLATFFSRYNVPNPPPRPRF